MDYIIAAIIILSTSIVIFITNRRNMIKMKACLKDSIGRKPADRVYSLDSIAGYHNLTEKYTDTSRYIDAITWNDLEMDKVFRRINTCLTSIGEECLFHLMHVPNFSGEEQSKLENMIDYLDRNPEQRYRIQLCLSKLGKMDRNNIASYIFDLDSKRLKRPYMYTVLAVLPLLCAASMLINLPMGIMLLIIALGINVIVNSAVNMRLENNLAVIQYFGGMLWSCKRVLGISDAAFAGLTGNLRSAYDVFKRYGSRLPRSMWKMGTDFDFISSYWGVVTFGNIRNYNSVVGQMSRHRDSLRTLYEEFGKIDIALSVLSFRRSLEAFCIPEFNAGDKVIRFDGVYHPLLEDAVTNSGVIAKNSIITGPNASGKSTFIKALAINAILAQTIHTCTAQRFRLRHSLVMTSMAVRDDLIKGESYFITEIISLKRILDKIEQMPCTCFIDEILRGTNTVERIAASSAILEYLDGRDCLCMIASHDMELAAMMDQLYDNYHFTENVTDDGIQFDFKLRRGIAASTNAIKLLGMLGYDMSIVKKARSYVDKYFKERSRGNLHPSES